MHPMAGFHITNSSACRVLMRGSCSLSPQPMQICPRGRTAPPCIDSSTTISTAAAAFPLCQRSFLPKQLCPRSLVGAVRIPLTMPGAHTCVQAEFAKLGVEATALLVGGASDEQLAACAELTQFAEMAALDAAALDLEGEGSGSSASGSAAAEGGADGAAEDKDKKKRDRGTAWTEDEHKLFLQGLDKYGKGDWRSISRQCVLTRTPAQVASHAQKYFIRQEGGGNEKPGRRVSIHDISSLDQSMPARNQRKRRKKEQQGAMWAANTGQLLPVGTSAATDAAASQAGSSLASTIGGEAHANAPHGANTPGSAAEMVAGSEGRQGAEGKKASHKARSGVGRQQGATDKEKPAGAGRGAGRGAQAGAAGADAKADGMLSTSMQLLPAAAVVGYPPVVPAPTAGAAKATLQWAPVQHLPARPHPVK